MLSNTSFATRHVEVFVHAPNIGEANEVHLPVHWKSDTLSCIKFVCFAALNLKANIIFLHLHAVVTVWTGTLTVSCFQPSILGITCGSVHLLRVANILDDACTSKTIDSFIFNMTKASNKIFSTIFLN